MNKRNTVILLSALAASVASAALTTTTTFDGTGNLIDAINWDSGLPTNANPGLVSSTIGSTWTGSPWTNVAIRQTGGTVGGAGSATLAMRGGASVGIDTIYEIEDTANSSFAYKNLEISGQLTMWAQNGGGHELSLLAGYATAGSLNAISNAANSTINIRDGRLDVGLINDGNFNINMLAGGTGQFNIADRNAGQLNTMRLNFESGNSGTITLSSNLGATSGGYWEFFVASGWASIDGVATTNAALFNIDTVGFATTISAIPEPSTYGMLAGFCTLALVMVRRRQ